MEYQSLCKFDISAFKCFKYSINRTVHSCILQSAKKLRKLLHQQHIQENVQTKYIVPICKYIYSDTHRIRCILAGWGNRRDDECPSLRPLFFPVEYPTNPSAHDFILGNIQQFSRSFVFTNGLKKIYPGFGRTKINYNFRLSYQENRKFNNPSTLYFYSPKSMAVC